jgi:hypothetical protein
MLRGNKKHKAIPCRQLQIDNVMEGDVVYDIFLNGSEVSFFFG